jgi:two-component system, NtrC family, sensor histidine kinase HydH
MGWKKSICTLYFGFDIRQTRILTIRKTLLIAFLLASLLPSVLLTLLTFHAAGTAMQDEIEQSLQVEATTVAQDIDVMLFERLQNAQKIRLP